MDFSSKVSLPPSKLTMFDITVLVTIAQSPGIHSKKLEERVSRKYDRLLSIAAYKSMKKLIKFGLVRRGEPYNIKAEGAKGANIRAIPIFLTDDATNILNYHLSTALDREIKI